MSHQLSFLQAFVEYDSVKCQRLNTLKVQSLLKRLQSFFRVVGKPLRQIVIISLVDMSEFQIQVCQRLEFFQQLSWYYSVSARGTIGQKWCYGNIDRLHIAKNQFIKKISKALILLGKDNGRGNIFNIYITMWLCKKILQIGHLNKQMAFSWKCCLIYDWQLNVI